jgi:uncharacterized OB-fold protein
VSDRYMPGDWVVPAVNDINREFFTSGELRLQKCRSCGIVQHPPVEVCNECQGFDFEYVAAAPEGVIDSYTIVHHPVHEMLKSLVPYNVAVISVSEYPHVRIVGNVVDASRDDVQIGRKVVAHWVTVFSNESTEPVQLAQWKLSD